MKIHVVIPLWKRPEVTKFCFEGLKKLIARSRYKIDVTCVISEEYYEVVCASYGFDVVFADNDPLGEKINKGIKHALTSEWDYLMMMNSDDIIEAELINEYYRPFFESLNPYFGVDKVTYVNFETHEAREVKYLFSVLGIGKCIRRDVVENMKGSLYDDERNKMLDDGMMDRMIRAGVSPTFVQYEGMLAMDFKSDTNIWPWEKFKNRGKIVCYKPQSEEVNLTATSH